MFTKKIIGLGLVLLASFSLIGNQAEASESTSELARVSFNINISTFGGCCPAPGYYCPYYCYPFGPPCAYPYPPPCWVW